MALPYWSVTELEDRIGRENVLAFLDDDRDGEPDDGPVERLQADCDSYVEGYLRPIYPDLEVVRANPPNQIKRLSLDCADMMLSRRHPEYPRRDWLDMKVALDAELDRLRTGKIRLDVTGSPEPAANNGGNLITPGATSGAGLIEAPALVFGGPCGMGDF